ncbi:hypothetical protein LCGC14_2916740 [marine sediment metagenome]|uniref:ArnR1-like winged helix-turn-helix domain-containing protein n=1 Tax=marine sediment metagenome TaxID=412755 RepID=A0A0F8XQA7_9ZZZZ
MTNEDGIFEMEIGNIYSYIIKKVDDTGKPIEPIELVKYFNLNIKQIEGYMLELEDMNLIIRSKDIHPQTIFPTEEGRKIYYDKILSLIPNRFQKQIKKLVKINKMSKTN